MEREDILKFTNLIIILSKLLTKTGDRFFAQKLHSKLSDLIFAFVVQRSQNVAQIGFHNAEGIVKSDDIVQHSVNVAQYRRANLLNSVNSILDYLEYLEHGSKSDTTPLLLAQRNLLKFKLHILRTNQTIKSAEEKVGDKAVVVSEVNLKSVTLKHKTAPQILKADSNKEKIFNFVKRTPDVRAKDVMNKFHALSGRTVKRNLKELISEGFLRKKLEGGAVYYLVTNL